VKACDAKLLRGAWDAFARGDVDAAVAALDPHARWCAGDGEGACRESEVRIASDGAGPRRRPERGVIVCKPVRRALAG